MEDISLHILDIAENSVNAGATLVQIRIVDKRTEDVFSVQIEDNGRGIPEERLEEVLDPFFTTRVTRKIGLGLSLLAQSARETGGDITIESVEDKGTSVTARFRPHHIDMKPVGDIAGTLLVLIAGNPAADFVLHYIRDDREDSFDTREIRAQLDGMPVNSAPVLTLIKSYLSEILTDIGKNRM